MKRISCIIPTYNEAPRIGNVIPVIATHPLIDEVIVVDDGSKDNTRQIVRDLMKQYPKLTLIEHAVNTGKSGAVATGIKSATGDYIAFIDADLVGITAQNLTDLIEPIREGTADITISLRKNAPAPWHWIGLDYISGERVMPRDYLMNICDHFVKLPRFGLESYMNRHMIKEKKHIKIVQWPNVESPWKYKKDGLVKGVWGDIKMIGDIFRTITPIGPVYQIIRMKQLEVK
jgi:glycosyltransferase involved in cell wall biosynthesis